MLDDLPLQLIVAVVENLNEQVILGRDIGNTFPELLLKSLRNKTLGRAREPRANGAWLSKLTE